MKEITNIYAIAALSVIGGGLFGFDISSMSAIISTSQYLCYFNEGPDYFGVSTESNPDGLRCSGPRPSTQGGITASMPGGSWVGALCSGYISDIFGRKRSIQVGSGFWIIGSIICAAAQNIGMLVAGRFINGFAVGICSAQVPVYISELAPPSRRGRLVGLQQWAITWGILIMFYLSYACTFIGPANGQTSFRLPWALQMIPGASLLLGLFFLPESPRWLAKKGRWSETERIITAIHGKGDVGHPFVNAELGEISHFVKMEKTNDTTYFDLFKKNMIFRTHVGVFTQIWSQLTGMNVMMYYITYVFAMAGLRGNTLLVSSSIQFVINVVMTLPALIWVDKWGRRPTLIVGGLLMCTWMFATGGIMGANGRFVPGGINGVRAVSWAVNPGLAAKAVVACTYLFVASFAPTWGPVSWIYPPELFPLRFRGKAVALCTSANWVFNFALSYFVPPAFENIQWRTYLIFGAFCAAMTIHVFLAFPETAGKSLEAVEEIFKSRTPAWKTHVTTKETIAAEHGEVEAKHTFAERTRKTRNAGMGNTPARGVGSDALSDNGDSENADEKPATSMLATRTESGSSCNP
ncbi:sugar transporter [Histoplasma capsulatum var. duboisii H88]|uniref:Sugar transporter n=1 Tax=Ajellomyces capsulatus (strain H88) TaxID=544711 RepID=F0URN4_AJEC8|nr:sugar transporter [Histoplasma capsulatum var. duboisii H88]QSS50569.1 sugar transporter [Histoplasma capsulatum var. duboisii H88]